MTSISFTRKNISIYTVITILIFSIYLIVGFSIFGDYSVSFDEPTERRSTEISVDYAEYVFNRLLSHNPGEISKEPADALANYAYRYYGVFLNIPALLIEKHTGIDTTDAYKIRHLLNFLQYFVACICFYLILKKRFQSKPIIPIFGLLMMIISPRFFGEAFYNNKDLLFISWCVIAIYFGFRFLEKTSLLNTLLFSFSLAVATTTRILALAIFLLAIAFMLSKFFMSAMTKQEKRHLLCYSALIVVFFILFYVVITPASWRHPISFLLELFPHFLHYQDWGSTHLYLGKMITKEVPWHYIPVWIAITTPIMYLVCFIAGFNAIPVQIIPKIKQLWKQDNLNMVYDSFMFLFFVCTLGGYIGFRISMYEGWRHAYMLIIPLLYVAAIGLSFLTDLLSEKKIFRITIYSLLLLSMLGNSIWMIKSHPYQCVYFNLPSRYFVQGYFELDYWRLSNKEAAEYILKTDTSDTYVFTLDYYGCFADMLPPEDRRFLRDSHDTDYIIMDPKRLKKGEQLQIEGYDKIYEVIVDKRSISTVYKKHR